MSQKVRLSAIKEIQDLQTNWEKSQMGSEAWNRQEAAEAGVPFPPEVTNDTDEEEEEAVEMEELEYRGYNVEKGKGIERTATNDGMDYQASFGAGDDEGSDDADDWNDFDENGSQHDEMHNKGDKEMGDEAKPSSSSSTDNAPKSKPVRSRYCTYTRADNPDFNTARFEQGKPEPERLEFYLTNTSKQKNGPWKFPGREDPNVVDWKSKEFIAKINKWLRQIINRTINKGDSIPTGNNATWTKFEMDLLEHILPKYIVKHQKITMTSEDWKVVTKKFNKAINNVKVPVGAPLATLGPGPNGNRTVPKERTLKKRSAHGLQCHVMVTWKNSLGKTVRDLLAAPREPDDEDEVDSEVSSTDESSDDEDSSSSSADEDEAPPKKKLKTTSASGRVAA